MNPAAGTPFARQSNLDIKTGEVIPPDDRRMVYQLANMLWHSDSSFKPVPSLCSLLSGRIISLQTPFPNTCYIWVIFLLSRPLPILNAGQNTPDRSLLL